MFLGILIHPHAQDNQGLQFFEAAEKNYIMIALRMSL